MIKQKISETKITSSRKPQILFPLIPEFPLLQHFLSFTLTVKGLILVLLIS